MRASARAITKVAALAGFAALAALTAGALLIGGCSSSAAPDARWTSTATETPQPGWHPPDAETETLTRMRDLVQRYLEDAMEGRRGPMLAAYTTETVRSAANVVARDLESAAAAGPGFLPSNRRSVVLHDGALWPPGAAPDVRETEAARLRELAPGHAYASIVLVDWADGSRRAFFAVSDGGRIALVP
ncbi:MAG TPA: hypothetical protein VF902_00935 [Coriobacteriia bacterium]